MLNLSAFSFKVDCILELDANDLQDLKIWKSHQIILQQEEGVTAIVILMKKRIIWAILRETQKVDIMNVIWDDYLTIVNKIVNWI